jgi:hypothetical protein
MNGQNKNLESGAGDHMINRYLLGEASAEEQTQIEERYFTDPDFLDQVVSTEDDLIDAYLRGGLSGRERERFEARFLASPARRERVENARALLTEIGDLPLRREVVLKPVSWSRRLINFFLAKPALELAMAAALVIAVAATAWLIIENRRLRDQVNQQQAESIARDEREKQLEQQLAQRDEPQPPAEETPSPTTDEEPKPTAPDQGRPAVASFLLVPGLTRNVEQVKRVVIPSGVETARVQLSVEVKGEYKNVRAALRRNDGREVWGRANLKIAQSGASRYAVLMIPARLLTPGAYAITLSGADANGATEVLGDYPFAVVKK